MFKFLAVQYKTQTADSRKEEESAAATNKVHDIKSVSNLRIMMDDLTVRSSFMQNSYDISEKNCRHFCSYRHL